MEVRDVGSDTIARGFRGGAVMLGTSSPLSPGGSCPSDYVLGRIGSDHWDLV